MWARRQRKGMSLDEARRRLYNSNYFGSCMVGPRRRRRARVGREPALSRDDPSGARGDRRASEGRPRERHVHARVREAGRSSAPTRRSTSIRRPSSWRRSRTRRAASRARWASSRASRCSRSRTSGRCGIPETEKMARAVALLRQRDPSLVVDGEMQADTAFDPRDHRPRLSVQHAQGTGERADFPELERGQHRVQVVEPPGRRDGDRADPRRNESAGARARAWRRRAGHRQHGRGRRGRRAGAILLHGAPSRAPANGPTPTIFSRL